MIHVDGNLNIDNYNDNTGSLITVSPQGTVVEQTVVQQPVEGSSEGAASVPITSTIRFSGKRGMKIDLYRVILALLENGFFTDQNGAKPTQKEVFDAFGQMLGSDFSGFHKDLSQSKLCNNGSDAPTRIFDLLKATIEGYYQST